MTGVLDAETLQRITGALTPAVMVSACGLLALGLDNQAARMTTRARDLARELRGLSSEQSRRAAAIRAEIAILVRRHRYYARALFCDYAALLAFVATSLWSLSAGSIALPQWVALTVFAFGVVMLLAMSVFTLAGVSLAGTALATSSKTWADGDSWPRR